MKSSTFLAVFAALLATALGWAKFESNYGSASRRSFGGNGEACVNSGEKCFTSGECCKGFVCAAFADLFGRQLAKRIEPVDPAVPGFCVREKDLHPCSSHADCGSDARCIPLGRNKEQYCIEKPRGEEENTVESLMRYSNEQARLGQPCKSDSDCKQFAADGSEMCCQEVRRFRQKAKKICDRITHMSRCHPKLN